MLSAHEHVHVRFCNSRLPNTHLRAKVWCSQNVCQTNASILHPFPVAAGKTNCKISKIVVPLFTASAPKLISSEAYINLAKQAKVACSFFNFEECKLESLWPGPMPPPQRFNKSVAQNTCEIRSHQTFSLPVRHKCARPALCHPILKQFGMDQIDFLCK